MNEQYSNELFTDVLTSTIEELEDIALETYIETIDDKILKSILKHADQIRKAKNFTTLDTLPTEILAKEFCESLTKNGFGFIPQSLLLIVCEQYILQVVKNALIDTDFEFLTQSIWDILIDRYDTQKRAKEETKKAFDYYDNSNPSDDGSIFTTKHTERGTTSFQEDNPSSNKETSSERGEKPSSTENEYTNEGAERGQKPLESENKTQGSDSMSRGERPQAPPQYETNDTTQRGIPPRSVGGEDSKAPTSSSSNPSDKISASSNSAKAADEASKVAVERATPKTAGMNM